MLRHISQLMPSVSIRGIRAETVLGLAIVADVAAGYGAGIRITSAAGGKHMPGSLHYVGLAIDFQIRGVSTEVKRAIVMTARGALGSEFDLVDELSHIHLEFQPKEGLLREEVREGL